MTVAPVLELRRRDRVQVLTDPGALSSDLLVAFTDRHGGVSAEPYDTLNLALSVGDERASVLANRRAAADACGFDVSDLALARQVHSNDILAVAPGRAGVLGEADGLWAHKPGPVLGILTADCAGVVIAGAKGVGVFHAGWRGLVAGVIEMGVAALGPVTAAWVGPCIRSCCYRVGPEVVDAFRARSLPVAGGNRIDISDAAQACLEAAGVTHSARADMCTHCDDSYFSYRRERTTGRQGAFVSLLAATQSEPPERARLEA